ncbi:hypothetical protein JI735_20880 [Paenibacillus sonchi]|uniref:Uncharacterized protein n=1 Tax=Paenibacillus sonchi TaxID=373687 RepID=A0A974P827_9BACL|nr:hypothetical protein [Paenibacillus sonchi]MCE3200151.1 hypothetical protein [Paenibacillus sonchi]QQZ59144.1 hypothetical protein JI735_20880 [Paenibacillus sonchi]
MKTGKFVSHIVKDWFAVCGCVTILVAIVQFLSSTGSVKASILWQIIVAASAFTCFKYALVSTPGLGKKAQTFCFYICFLLADVFVIVWLWLFSSGPFRENERFLPFLITSLVIKGMVYTMLHIDGQKEAKRLNEKLGEYQKGGKA